ncbi:PqqD family peptide modification chaperone [Eubacterium ramulus]|nr:PqqD family peptide modification chaperone [Eubacterium ramulus]
MCSDSEKNMSAFADQNHAPSLTCVRLELIIPLEMEIFMLKQQQGYVLSKIGPHTYLLPYGQSIADQKHGIIINETGEFLWKMLETPQSMDTLITALAGHYHMDITALQLLSSTVPVYFLFSGYIPKTDILP